MEYLNVRFVADRSAWVQSLKSINHCPLTLALVFFPSGHAGNLHASRLHSGIIRYGEVPSMSDLRRNYPDIILDEIYQEFGKLGVSER